MQPHPNNKLRKLPSEKGKGLAGTAIIHLVVLAILVIVAFTAPKPPEKETGILVNFGTDETGSGLIEPSPPASNEETAAALPENAAVNPVKEESLQTQNFDKESPEVKKADPEAEKKKKELIEAERIRQAEIEADRVKKAQEEAERKRVEAEQKRISDIATRTKNALANSKNTGTNTKGEGITGGPGNQGVPTGSVDSKVRGDGSGTGDKGISYVLSGRKSLDIPIPNYDYNDEGIVVVKIQVDRTGKVIQATPGAPGTTIMVDYFMRVAKEAALKAKFEPLTKPDAAPMQVGTITYNFKLK